LLCQGDADEGGCGEVGGGGGAEGEDEDEDDSEDGDEEDVEDREERADEDDYYDDEMGADDEMEEDDDGGKEDGDASSSGHNEDEDEDDSDSESVDDIEDNDGFSRWLNGDFDGEYESDAHHYIIEDDEDTGESSEDEEVEYKGLASDDPEPYDPPPFYHAGPDAPTPVHQQVDTPVRTHLAVIRSLEDQIAEAQAVDPDAQGTVQHWPQVGTLEVARLRIDLEGPLQFEHLEDDDWNYLHHLCV